jgi:hypothetical protein
VIVAAALCPAAPLLVPGLADALAAEVPQLVAAATRAADYLVAVADRLLVLTVGRRTEAPYPVPSDLGANPFGRAAGAPPAAGALPGDGRPLHDPALWVARALVGPARLIAWQVGPEAPAAGSAGEPTAGSAGEPTAGSAGAPVDRRTPAGFGETFRADPDAIGVLVLADGAICHGADAPAAEDPRALPFDDALHAALGADPAELGRWSRGNADLGAALGATAPAALAVLAELLVGADWTARAEDFGHPFGVGYHVARWQR